MPTARPALSWSVPPAAPKPRPIGFDKLRRLHASPRVASYSRFMQSARDADEGFVVRARVQAPTEITDLPGGPLWGVVLHELLERVPLASFANRPAMAAWQALSPVRRLFEQTLDQYGQDPSYLPFCQQLVYRALTMPLEHDGKTLGALAHAGEIHREVEFIFRGSIHEAELVRGFLDVVFVHAGQTFLLDWKSDTLPAWTPDALTAHVAERYLLQARLYLLAMAKMLGITDASGYQERIGGFFYCFLRGLEHGQVASIFQVRPSWPDVCRAEQELLGVEP